MTWAIQPLKYLVLTGTLVRMVESSGHWERVGFAAWAAMCVFALVPRTQ